jgi:hypothetical protein
MTEEQLTGMYAEDELDSIAQTACLELIEADSDVETLLIQYVTTGTYSVAITERGCEPREATHVQRP